MPTFVELQAGLVERLEEQVHTLEEANDPEDEQLLADLRQQLEDEKQTRDTWQRLQDSPTAAQPAPAGTPGGINAVVIGGPAGAAVMEKDWKIVFDYFPGLRARFEEIYQLDQRESLLFASYSDPSTRTDWRQAKADVMAVWPNFKDEMSRKLVLLGTPRKVSIGMRGHVHDADWPDPDDTLDYNEEARSTLRFGEMFPIDYKPTADEVSLSLNLQCRLAVGPADSVEVAITGNATCYEDGDVVGSNGIDERLGNGGESRNYHVGNAEDEYGTLTLRMDFRP